MSKPKYDYSAVVAAYKADPTIADTLPDTLRTHCCSFITSRICSGATLRKQ